MVNRIFYCILSLSILFSASIFANDQSVLLRYKPRVQESIYTYYSRSETLFNNAKFQKYVASSSQAYVGLRTVQTLENGYLVQRAGVHAGNIVVNDQVYAHPSLGKYVEYVLAPWGGIPKAMGNTQQFKIKNLQLVLPQDPVSVGSSWTVTLPKTPGFPIKTEHKYEVTSIMGGLVIIHSKVDAEKKGVYGGLNFTLKGSAQLIFNADEGILVRNESNQYVEVSKSAKGKDYSTKMNVNSIMELQF